MNILSVFLMAAVCQALPARAAGELRLGVQDNLGYEETVKTWTPTADYLSGKLGRKVTLVPLSALESPYALAEKDVDLLLAGPVTQELLHRKINSDFLLTLERRMGENRIKGTGGTLFYAAGAIKDLKDLRGRRIAATFRESISVLALKAALRKEGAKRSHPELYFTGDSSAALRELRSGKADGALIPTVAFYRALESGRIKPGEFEVFRFKEAPASLPFSSTAIYQGLILSALEETDSRVIDKVVEALLGLREDDPAARAGYYTRWTHASHNHELQRILESEGLIQPRHRPLSPLYPAGAAALAMVAGMTIMWLKRRYCQGLIAGIKHPALLVDKDCNILYANAAAYSQLGLRTGTLNGLKCYKAAHGREDRPADCAELRGDGAAAACIESFSRRLGKNARLDALPLSGGRILCVVRESSPVDENPTRAYHSEQIEAMSRLAAAMAHQFNNTLSVIGAALHLLRHGSGDKDRDVALSSIENAARSAAGTTRQLLTLSRSNRIRKVLINIADIVRDVLKIHASHPDAVRVETHLQQEMPPMAADPLEISRLIQYILGSAEFASPEGEPVEITLSSAAMARPDGGDGAVFAELRFTRLCAGFDQTAIKTIFQPGLETNRWGLALAYSIARKHGGWIEASYSWSRTLTFTVYLPAEGTLPAEQQAVRPAPAAQAVKGETPALRILLAEDDDELRDMTARILEKEGHSVATARDGHEAMKLLGSGTYDLLLSDVVMPGPGGRELAEAAPPGTRVILLSGHANGTVDHQSATAKGWTFIQKPYDTEILMKAIRGRTGERI